MGLTNLYHSNDNCMSYKESMEMRLTARNVVHVNMPFTHVSFCMLEAFAGMKSSKKKASWDFQVSNASCAPIILAGLP